MPKVVREDIDNLNAVLTVTIDQESYEPKFIEELKKYRNKASMRGFRKGKTPLSFLKKAYGKPLLAEIVQEMLQTEMSKFIQEGEANYLGQPIPNADSPSLNFDVRELGDYIFKFDIGIAPEFEVNGIESIKSFEQLVVDISDEMLDAEIETIRKRKGVRTEIEEDIQDNDLLSLNMKELEGDEVKEEGWESTVSILVSQIANEDLKKELLTKKKGDIVKLNPHDLEEASEDHIKKYILNMKEEDMDREVGDAFEATIESVNRVVLAELNQEFFDGHFGPNKVNTEEEFKAEIKKDMASFYEGDANSLLFRDIRKDVLASNEAQLPLPEGFLKRWLVAADERNTEELIDRDFPRFADQLRWSLISTQLSEKFEVKVEELDIRNHLQKKVMAYMGGYVQGNMDLLNGMMERILQDPEQLTKATEELINEKVFDSLKENFSIEDKVVSVDDFKEISEKARAEDAPPPPPSTDSEEEE